MKTKTYTVYKFDELPEEGKRKAVEKYYDINGSYDWWNFIYEDAEQIGLKISEFDIDRASYCNATFTAGAVETAHKIEKEHGETCETYKTAKAFLAERDAIVENAPRDENGDFEDESALDELLDECEAEFLKSLCEDYRIILTKEYEYLTSEEAIIEALRCNDYDFTENGEID